MNAPGQEEGAAPLPEGYEYPTMEQLAEQVGFRSVICSPFKTTGSRSAQPFLPGPLHRHWNWARR